MEINKINVDELFKLFSSTLGDRSDYDVEQNKNVIPFNIDDYDVGKIVEFATPGVDSSLLDLGVKDGNVLVLSYVYKDNGYYTEITLGDEFDIDNISSGYSNGLLTVKVPFKEDEGSYRQIKIS